MNVDLQSAILVFGGYLWLYMVMLRSFLGFTLGDWACGLRLGAIEQRLGPGYSLRVVFRAGIFIATGIIFLPILSLIVGRDLAGQWSGLQLWQVFEGRQ